METLDCESRGIIERILRTNIKSYCCSCDHTDDIISIIDVIWYTKCIQLIWSLRQKYCVTVLQQANLIHRWFNSVICIYHYVICILISLCDVLFSLYDIGNGRNVKGSVKVVLNYYWIHDLPENENERSLKKIRIIESTFAFYRRKRIHQIWCFIFIKGANICHLGNTVETLLHLTKFLINLNWTSKRGSI